MRTVSVSLMMQRKSLHRHVMSCLMLGLSRQEGGPRLPACGMRQLPRQAPSSIIASHVGLSLFCTFTNNLTLVAMTIEPEK